jgi:1-acyl-sn-glycerol-3-phosphate acyltransferase
MERFMVYGCILGSIGHFIFFGVLGILIIPGYISYLILSPFLKEPMTFFQWGASLSYKIFFFLTPKIVLKKYLRDDIPKSAIYISTHQSILDFPALSTFIKRYLIFANVNLGKYPIVAYICDIAGVKYISGKGIDKVSEIYNDFEKQLNEGKNVIFFAEGTRHTGDKLLDFKRGAFRLSKKTNKPIVPVVVEGAYKLLPRKAWCFRTTKRTKIHVKVLKPLYPNDFKSDKEMLEYAYKIMQDEKEKLAKID